MTALRVYNNYIDDFFKSFTAAPMSSSVPVDIRENNSEYTFFFDVPGIQKENITVNIKERELTVEASAEEKKEEEGKYLQKNRRTPSFKKVYTLPEDSDGETLSASLEDGVLTLNLKKRPESAPRTVSIN